MKMRTSVAGLPDVLLIEPQVFHDPRGFFLETYQAEKFARAGITDQFVQDNLSGSKRNVLRGLHYQVRRPQGKLVRAVSGEVFDVVVDLRRGSPTFGRWAGEVLSAENRKMLWAPPGFAHGFYVLSDWAEVAYKTTDYYVPDCERSILWNDPGIGIEWPVPSGLRPVLSDRDAAGKTLKEAEVL